MLALQLEPTETSEDFGSTVRVHYKLGSQISEPYVTMLEGKNRGVFIMGLKETCGMGEIRERFVPATNPSLTGSPAILGADIRAVLSTTQFELRRLVWESLFSSQDMPPDSHVEKIAREARDRSRVLSDFQLFVTSPVIQQKFAGKYISIFNGEVIGSGTTAKEAYDNARKVKPQAKPALTFVPEEDVCIFGRS